MRSTIKKRWEILNSKRTSILDKKRACARITIPELLPDDGSTQQTVMLGQNSSVQARGVLSLSSKMVSVLIPLDDNPFFGIRPRTGGQFKPEMAAFVDALTRQIHSKIIANNLREATYRLSQQIQVIGDSLLICEDDYTYRTVRADHFVVRRSVKGDIKEIIYLEFVGPPNSEELTYLYNDHIHGQYDQAGTRTVYVRVYRDEQSKVWKVEKELNDEVFENGEYEVTPYAVVRWNAVDGEDYGRSHVEDIYADISALESYTRSMKQGLAASSTFFMGLKSSSTSTIDIMQALSNGTWFTATERDDVFCVSPGETMNPQVVVSSNAVEYMRKEVAQSFLMHGASLPTGDRVTATAVRAIGQELETVLGGVFSSIARDLLIPIVNRTIHLMLKNNEIDPRFMGMFDAEDGILGFEIYTGLAALNKESNLTRLFQMGEMIRNLPPEVTSVFKWSSYATALISNLGFDHENWVKSEEEVKAEMAEKEKATQKNELQKIMAGGLAQAANTDIAANGGKNIPPNALGDMANMLGEAMQ